MTPAAPHLNPELTPAESAELYALWCRWQSARIERRYPAADILRDELAAFGVAGQDMLLWHPVYEEAVGR